MARRRRICRSVLFAVATLASASCFDFKEPRLITDDGMGGGVSPGGSGGGDSGSGGGDSGGGGNGGTVGQGAGGEPAAGGAPSVDVPVNGLALWFSSELGVTEVDGAVGLWENQAALGVDASQSLIGSRPRRVQSTDPFPVLEFDGVSQHLVLDSGFDNFEAGLSFFVVTRLASLQSCPGILYLGNEPFVDDIVFSNDHALGTYYRVGSNEFTDSTGFGEFETTLVSVVHSPVDESVLIFLNAHRTLQDNGVLPATLLREQNFIGQTLDVTDEGADCDGFFDGRVAELLLYNRAVDQTEQGQIEEYLSRKWQCCGFSSP